MTNNEMVLMANIAIDMQKNEVNEVLDKIRAEIEQTTSRYTISRERDAMGQVEWSDRLIKENEVLEIIDKYKTESLEQEPTTKENLVVGDCMKREFIEIVVEYPPADLCTYPEYRGKPYYSILYRDEDSRNHVGFGTYKIEMLSQWIKQYFMSDIQPKPKTDEPMQVDLEGDGYADGKLVYDYGKCPKCGWEFEHGEKDWEEPYCCHCGQKLHWFESEDKG